MRLQAFAHDATEAEDWRRIGEFVGTLGELVKRRQGGAPVTQRLSALAARVEYEIDRVQNEIARRW